MIVAYAVVEPNGNIALFKDLWRAVDYATLKRGVLKKLVETNENC